MLIINLNVVLIIFVLTTLICYKGHVGNLFVTVTEYVNIGLSYSCS